MMQVKPFDIDLTEPLKEYVAGIKPLNLRLKAYNKIPEVCDEVTYAANQFLAYDFQGATEIALEPFTQRQHDLGTVQGSQDLVIYSDTEDSKKIRIVDWKRVGRLDGAKKRSYANSYQVVLYLEYFRQLHPDFELCFEFRFFNVEYGIVDPIIIPFNQATHDMRLKEIEALDRAINHNTFTGVWPRNRQSCKAFGTPCPFEEKCWLDLTDLIQIENPLRSQSLYDTYQLCPQRYARINQICLKDGLDYHDIDDGTIYSVLGSMFHKGIQLVYLEALNNLSPETEVA